MIVVSVTPQAIYANFLLEAFRLLLNKSLDILTRQVDLGFIL